MFDDKYFYHEHIRKAIIAFGTMFNGIIIRRKDNDNEVAQSMKVPLSYSTKQKMISRVLEVDDLEGREKYNVTLPRMSFEIVSLTYDGPRKLPQTQIVRAESADGSKYAYVSTPYNIRIVLSVFSKNQDDALQIVEQIFPYFNPDFNITVHEIPDLKIKRDIQFILDSVDYSANAAGEFTETMAVIWDLTFTIKMNFFGYVRRSELIRRTIANIYSNYNSTLPAQDLIGTKITTEVDPFDAPPPLDENAVVGEDFDFIQEFDDIYIGDLE